MKKLFTILSLCLATVALNAQMTITDDFESYTNFTINPESQWTFVDVDQDSTYGFNGNTFENNYSPMAFIVFNPSACQTDVSSNFPAHSGAKYMAGFALVTTAQNNDWMISPVLDGNSGSISFFARALTNQYGLESFNVAYSTTTNETSAFTNINSIPVTVDTSWVEFTYAFPAGTQYVAIQYVSTDVFALFIDDVTIQTTVGISENTTSQVAVFPNPATNVLNVPADGYKTIEIVNLLGQVVYSNNVTEATMQISVRDLNKGIYFVRLANENGVATQKFIKK